MLTDYWLRRGDFGDELIFVLAAQSHRTGFVAMLVAGATSISLFAAQALDTGPVPLQAPQLGDRTFLVGFVLAARLDGRFHGVRRIASPRADAAPRVA